MPEKQLLIIGAVIVGVWAGLTAVLLKISVHYLQEQIRTMASTSVLLYMIAPAVGILLSLAFVHFVLKGDLQKGTSHVMLAIANKSSRLPRKETFSHAITSALTVGFGGSAGLESPIVQTGSAIGSTFASFFPIGFRNRTLLLACGAAAGIATAFNAPIAGVLFALEVLLVDISISAFIPLLIAGATGALCSKIILSENILLSFRHISNFNYHNVPYYIALGIVCGLVSVFYLRVFRSLEGFFRQTIKHHWLRFLIGVSMLGGLIVLFPPLLGEGYSSIITLATLDPGQLFTDSPLFEFVAHHPVRLGLLVLIVGLVKVVAVTCTLSAGGNGGNFAPALLVGACIGFAFSFLINVTGVGGLPTSNFSLVAMAGLLTGIFHAPLTAIFLIAEITGGYDLIIPLMIVSALSTAVSKYLNPKSLDQAKLEEDGGMAGISKDTHVLSELSAKSFIERDFVAVSSQHTLRELLNKVANSKRNIFPVLNENGTLAGVIYLENIREIMFNASLYDVTKVTDLMQPPVLTVDAEEPMSAIMEKFDKSGVWNIPVIQEGKYAGFISKSRIFSTYRERMKVD
ncbi:MAG TPA: chloride channel protein [Cyclobacteriaceae bacterium]|nr:chloride channel protein [Cyclobacteriaceae bacterium]HMV91381.1 chloride channel protein [Cyclobacteriaceae bacterium]HMX01864.1 chloride channel protein [Cyclobacteriaceae bacterium]HMX50788.1 chloride channel protein [Cyclobacteriaceae bacterium]HMY94688.1 chloride channel protein [Cyclobacteriaceae bacterium]